MSETLIELITFSSPYHHLWFFLTMLWLLVSCLLARYGGRVLFAHSCVLHAIVALETMLILLFDRQGLRVFSAHCIWFNSLMAWLHWTLLKSCLRNLAPPEQATGDRDGETESADDQT